MRGAARALHAASQTLGRYRFARRVAGAQHSAAKDRRIHHLDRSDPGVAMWNSDGSGNRGLAETGGASGEPRSVAAHRLDFVIARAFRSLRSGDVAQFGARGNGGGDGETYQRSAARGALSERPRSWLG